jgi:hypothetical protein
MRPLGACQQVLPARKAVALDDLLPVAQDQRKFVLDESTEIAASDPRQAGPDQIRALLRREFDLAALDFAGPRRGARGSDESTRRPVLPGQRLVELCFQSDGFQDRRAQVLEHARRGVDSPANSERIDTAPATRRRNCGPDAPDRLLRRPVDHQAIRSFDRCARG